MFWFTLFLIVLVLWLSERSSAKKKINDMYRRGYLDGYELLRAKLNDLVDRDQVDKQSVGELIGITQQGETTKTVDEPVVQQTRDSDNGTLPEQGQTTGAGPALAPSYVAQTSVAPPPVFMQELTPEQLEEAKAKQTITNLNLMLYTGSFLIVAAVAVFVGLTMPGLVKLGFLLLVTMCFYVAGLVLHALSARLRVAGVAFVGTALAIVPFIGFALPSLIGISPEYSWLITSVFGLIVYGFASARLQSQLVSYITMAYVLSLSLSMVSTLSLGIMWYFIVLVGVSAVLNSLHYLFPNALPKYFWVPVEQTSIITTPIALSASLVMFWTMDAWMYAVLYGVSAMHYLVVWLERRKYPYEMAVRVMMHLTVIAASYAMWPLTSDFNRTAINIVWIGMILLQAIYSMARAGSDNKNVRNIEIALVGVSSGLIAISSLSWLIIARPEWWLVSTLTISASLFAVSALRFKQVGWLYGTLAISTILPMLVLRWAIQPPLNYHFVAGVYAVLAVATLAGVWLTEFERRKSSRAVLLQVSSITYLACMVLAGLAMGTDSGVLWTMALVAILLTSLSYAVRQVAVQAVATPAWLFAVIAFSSILLQANREWLPFLISTVFIGSMLIMATVHQLLGQQSRRNIGVVAGAIYMLSFVWAGVSANSLIAKLSLGILLAGAIVAIVVRCFAKNKTSLVAIVVVAGYVFYPLIGLILCTRMSSGWLVLTLAVYMAIIWLASYIEKVPWLMLVGNLALMWLINVGWEWLNFSSDWQMVGTLLAPSAISYLVYWINLYFKDEQRRSMSFLSVETLLALATLFYIFSGDKSFAITGALSLLAGAIVLGVEGVILSKRQLTEASIYIATFALQRLTNIVWPEANIVLYGHWWALVIVLTGLWFNRQYVEKRLIIGLAFVTLPTMLYALMGHTNYSIFFLIEHVVVITIGALLRKSWMIWWGIISVVMGVLYFIRNQSFLVLALLGSLIIAFVVWRLLKVGDKSNQSKQQDTPKDDTGQSI